MPIPAAEQERQARVVAWLAQPAAHGGQAVERMETHAALVFLAGERAYKMKRAVDVGWMDFSTLEKREAVCRAELALNRRTAPELYLEVLPVTEADGKLALGGEGTPVEWLLVMRRFAQEERFDHLLEAGALTPALLTALADAIAAFHEEAEIRCDQGGFAGLAQVAVDNAADLERTGELVPAETRQRLVAATEAALQAGAALLDARREAGLVRRCHGDLHLANIVRWQGRPLLYDCVEFNETLGTCDVLYDLAFLIMDLDRRGRRDFANLVLNRWIAPAQLAGLALLPLFLSLRAAIRAKVAALGAGAVAPEGRADLVEEARRYVASALSYLEPVPPRLVAVGGLSGSGKSTLARYLAPLLGRSPGALLVRSDVVRKRLFGVPPETPLPAEAYTPEWHARVAGEMLRQTETALTAGQAVVMDAVHGRADTQAESAAVARRCGVAFDGLWLEAPAEVLLARVAGRTADASDATVEVVRRQLEGERVPTSWRQLDASDQPDAVLAAARSALGI